jgi:hypothetical protein
MSDDQNLTLSWAQVLGTTLTRIPNPRYMLEPCMATTAMELTLWHLELVFQAGTLRNKELIFRVARVFREARRFP